VAKKSKNVRPEKNPTKYYRATYTKQDGTQEEEVYISESLQSAYDYATGPNANGRSLDKLLEYEDFIDALL
jgi:hypothetical protein